MIRGVWFAVWSVALACVSAGARQAPADAGAIPGPGPRSIAWREDLQYLADELPKRHIEPFHTISREEWERRVADLDGAIPSLEDHQVVARLAALVAAVGDAHTSLNTRARFGQYPLQLRAFPDGVYVIGATPGQADLLGTRLVSIDGTDADRAREAVGAMATRENDVMHRVQTTRLLVVPEALHAFGVAKSVDRAEFTFARGEEVHKHELTPVEPDKPVSWRIPDALTGDSAPIYLHDQGLPYWWAWLDDGAILYVAYNRCASDAQRPFPAFAKEVVDEIDKAAKQQTSKAANEDGGERGATGAPGQQPGANGQQPFRVVIDLRNNGGGNSAIAMPLIGALRENKAVNRRGRLFVLIGARTQSSAMMNALQLRNGTEAILVGEPTGGRPNSYGEMRELKLPRSGLTVWYSTKYFRQVRGEDPPSVMPDELVEPTAAEFFTGKDPVMERVRAWKE